MITKNIKCLSVLLLLPFGLLAQQKSTDRIEQVPNAVANNNIYFTQTTEITLKTALKLTEIAREKASSMGKNVSIAILDGTGTVILISKGDGVGPHNTEAARRKAYTAVSTKTSTLKLARNARANPDTENLANLPELLLLGGGVPLWYEGKVIGSIGVAGGGGAENDDLIAKSAEMPALKITTLKD